MRTSVEVLDLTETGGLVHSPGRYPQSFQSLTRISFVEPRGMRLWGAELDEGLVADSLSHCNLQLQVSRRSNHVVRQSDDDLCSVTNPQQRAHRFHRQIVASAFIIPANDADNGDRVSGQQSQMQLGVKLG